MKQIVVTFLGILVLSILLSLLICIIFAYPTMLLWNWLIIKIFDLPSITFLEAFGLNFLCCILFKPSVLNVQNNK